MKYDVIIIGAGPGGIFSAYELVQQNPDLKIAVFESGHPLEKRHCPIDGDKIKSCINCKSCSIMSGFGGAGAFSDGKYNITNAFGGTLYEYRQLRCSSWLRSQGNEPGHRDTSLSVDMFSAEAIISRFSSLRQFPK